MSQPKQIDPHKAMMLVIHEAAINAMSVAAGHLAWMGAKQEAEDMAKARDAVVVLLERLQQKWVSGIELAKPSLVQKILNGSGT